MLHGRFVDANEAQISGSKMQMRARIIVEQQLTESSRNLMSEMSVKVTLNEIANWRGRNAQMNVAPAAVLRLCSNLRGRPLETTSAKI